MKPRQLVSLIFLFVMLGAGICYIALHRERFAVIFTVPLSGMASVAALVVLSRAIEALVLRLTVRELKADIGILESHLLAWTTRYWNYLPMKPGTGALAVYMKRKRGLPYSQFLSYFLAVNLLTALSCGVLGLAVTVPMYLTRDLTPLIPTVFAGIVASSAGVMAVPTNWNYSGRSFVLRAVSQVGHAWHQMRRRRGLLVRIGLWKTAQGAVWAASLYLCSHLVGISDALPQAVVVALLRPVTMLISVTPGGLGIREALVGAVMMAFGRSFTGGVIAATLQRAAGLSLLIVIGPLASHRVFLRFLPSPGTKIEDEPAMSQEPTNIPPAP